MRAVILTKSAMNKDGKKGACTTAYVPEIQKIVRLVVDQDGSPIPYNFAQRYSKLSVVEVPVQGYCPIGPQTENCVVDPTAIRVVEPYTQNKLGLFQQCSEIEYHGPPILGDGCRKFDSVDGFQHSVEVRFVSEFRIEKGQFGDPKAHFKVGRVHHHFFSVTDFDYDIRQNNDRNRLDVGDAWVVASIPSAPLIRDGDNLGCFVFIAAIYPIDML